MVKHQTNLELLAQIKTLRLQRNWTQAELTDKMGIYDPNYISRWEIGMSLPSVKSLHKMERAFGLPACSLSKLRVSERSKIEPGAKFGYLTTRQAFGKDNQGSAKWLCDCDCGNSVNVSARSLILGKTRSCGCLKSEKSRQQLGLVSGTSIRVIQNNKPRSDNKLGVRGVVFCKGKYEAYLTLAGKRMYFGRFDRLEDAAKAREMAEKQHYEPILESYKNS